MMNILIKLLTAIFMGKLFKFLISACLVTGLVLWFLNHTGIITIKMPKDMMSGIEKRLDDKMDSIKSETSKKLENIL